jgi:hypothetical protein
VVDASPCPIYEVNSTSTGAAFSIANSTDPLTHQSLLRWGNVTTILQGTDTPANSGIRFVPSEVPQVFRRPMLCGRIPYQRIKVCHAPFISVLLRRHVRS